MRPPRWLLVTLLTASVLAVLGAGAWWWATWPERTAKEFVDAVNVEELERAESVLTQESIPLDLTLRPCAADDHRGEKWTIDALPRSPWDILIGRQEFKRTNRIRARATATSNTH